MKTFLPTAALTATAFAAAATSAHAATDRGYVVTYQAASQKYCVRPLTADEAARLGILVLTTECHSAAAWATIGLKLIRPDGTRA